MEQALSRSAASWVVCTTSRHGIDVCRMGADDARASLLVLILHCTLYRTNGQRSLSHSDASMMMSCCCSKSQQNCILCTGELRVFVLRPPWRIAHLLRCPLVVASTAPCRAPTWLCSACHLVLSMAHSARVHSYMHLGHPLTHLRVRVQGLVAAVCMHHYGGSGRTPQHRQSTCCLWFVMLVLS